MCKKKIEVVPNEIGCRNGNRQARDYAAGQFWYKDGKISKNELEVKKGEGGRRETRDKNYQGISTRRQRGSGGKLVFAG